MRKTVRKKDVIRIAGDKMHKLFSKCPELLVPAYHSFKKSKFPPRVADEIFSGKDRLCWALDWLGLFDYLLMSGLKGYEIRILYLVIFRRLIKEMEYVSNKSLDDEEC